LLHEAGGQVSVMVLYGEGGLPDEELLPVVVG
jgi:hypothetical protein